jgi:RNA polymerase-binding transcription factor DksA
MSDGPATELPTGWPEETPDVCLAAEHDRLVGLVSALRLEDLDVEPESTSIDELAAAGQHPADLASETFERERDLTLLTEFRAELDENEDAAARLKAGCYGWCDDCHRPIDLARLAAVPATHRCLACQERYELDSLLADGPAGGPPMEPDDLGEYLPDDDREPATMLGPEEAALHLEG